MSYKSRVRTVAEVSGLPYQRCFVELKALNGKIVALMKQTGWPEEQCDVFYACWEFDPDAVDPEAPNLGWYTRYIEEAECHGCRRPMIHGTDKKGISVYSPSVCHHCRSGPYEYRCLNCSNSVSKPDMHCEDCQARLDYLMSRDD